LDRSCGQEGEAASRLPSQERGVRPVQNTPRTKKFINAPDNIIAEMIEGMVAAHSGLLRVEGPTGRAIVARDGPRDGKVGIVIGGGSGHEPAFALYVGRGLADAAAVGNIFASPSPAQIMDAARAADGGAGVVMLYGNYSGDVMNFTMAAEMLEAAGIAARQIQVTDDVASAPRERVAERRGIAGDFFVFKIAGAAADRGAALDEVVASARRANAATRSMGVALEPCSLPQVGRANFQIGEGEMEIGMGLHGEPGVRREPMGTADAVTDALVGPLLDELNLQRGDSVAVLINGLGATSLLELFILNRRLVESLAEREVVIHASWVGEYATSLEMAGASITLMKLDDDLAVLLDHPCRTPALSVGPFVPAAATARSHHGASAIETSSAAVALTALKGGGRVTPALFRSMMEDVAREIAAQRDWLSALDGVIGDGDHGVTMEMGWTAAGDAIAAEPADRTIAQLCDGMGLAFLNAVGASSGPLYSTALQRAAKAVRDRADLDAAAMARWVEALAAGVAERGGAAPGDKTMMDAFAPAAEAAVRVAAGGASELGVLEAARDAAETGMKSTANIEARRGRSAKLGARSIGHIDPGAASAFLLFRAMAAGLSAALTSDR
jgi:dihydroxyacetone kinase phosphoprotein-dependent L subunit